MALTSYTQLVTGKFGFDRSENRIGPQLDIPMSVIYIPSAQALHPDLQVQASKQ
jgi:hypothetical protein